MTLTKFVVVALGVSAWFVSDFLWFTWRERRRSRVLREMREHRERRLEPDRWIEPEPDREERF